ncbi:PREDICTED: uncharacterized protein LOC109177113 isoform X1 [Ipomoea nil]|uniref:uncharacterized protein LOC109177113 isoform X1 n=1 Tax=Ipomoea nil TaxID=35883 RepID=UPI0009014E3C|nr:PREDICTED: uncharacterized protein LOC109177113 isoform X1 [Ipomoea nil]
MSGPPREKSVNHAESEVRPVLGPAGNKARSLELRKPAEKLKSNKVEKSPESDGGKKKSSVIPAAAAEGGDQLSKPRFQVATSKKCGSVGSVLRRQQEQRSFLMRSNLSMNASCSSDASSESSQSQASTGNISLDSVTPRSSRRRQCGPKTAEKAGSEVESLSMSSDDFPLVKKRCAWVTTNTDPLYAAFHDEEWGVPVHDDRNLFELLSLSTALAELSWPTILSRRQAFKEVFQNFDPVAVSKLNEKKITVPGNPASSLLSELKLRAIIENARHVCKIIDEIGSFDKYVWGFVNHRPIVGQFRYPRQVPIKTSKAEAISKDLVRRGFRGVGPTVIYSFMQVSGITNDHLISCFRFHECMAWGNARNKGDSLSAAKLKVKQPEDDDAELGLVRAIDNSSLST